MASMSAFFLVVVVALSHYLISNAQTEEERLSIKYYTSVRVSRGETLWSIAEEYSDEHYDNIGDYIDEVVSINHLKNREYLKDGQYLIIPYYSENYVK